MGDCKKGPESLNNTNVNERIHAADLLMRIDDTAPFSRADRFKECCFYVLDRSGEMFNKLQILRGMLDAIGSTTDNDFRMSCTFILV